MSANLVDRARLAWLWYVRFYKGVILFVLAWWFWPVLVLVLMFPFVLLQVWWTGTISPISVATSGVVDTNADLAEAQTLIANVHADAHALLRRVDALRPYVQETLTNGDAELTSAWKAHRDFDPEPIVAAGLEQLVALDASSDQLVANPSDSAARLRLNRAVTETRDWAANTNAKLQSIHDALSRIETRLFHR